MKKLLFISSIFLASISWADSTTNRMHLTLPTIGSPTWGQKVNGNFQIIDATAAALAFSNSWSSTNTYSGYTQFLSTVNWRNLNSGTGQCLGLDSSSNTVIVPCGTGGGGGITTLGTLTPGATTFIFNQNTLQSGSSFYVGNGSIDGTGTSSNYALSVTGNPSSNVGGILAQSASTGLSGYALQGFKSAGTAPAINAASNAAGGTALSASVSLGNSSSVAGLFDAGASGGIALKVAAGSVTLSNLTPSSLVTTDSGDNLISLSTQTFIQNTSTLQSGATFYVAQGTVDGTLTANTQLSAVNNGFSVAAGDYGAGSIQAGVSGWAGQFSTQYPFSVLGSFSGHNGHAMQIKDTRAPGYGNVLLDFKYNNDSILTQQGGGALNAFADAQGEHFQIIAGSGNILLLDPSNVVLNRQLLVSTINVTSQFLANGSAGTAGQVLQSNGTSAAPSWVTASSGGASTLAVATGTSSGFTTTASSPTAVIDFSSDTFNARLIGGATAFVTLNASSVTLNGRLVAGSNITLTPGTGITTIAASGGAGSPGGTTGQVQWNSGGSFAGVSGSTISTSGIAIAMQAQHLTDTPIEIKELKNQTSDLLDIVPWNGGGSPGALFSVSKSSIVLGAETFASSFDMADDHPIYLDAPASLGHPSKLSYFSHSSVNYDISFSTSVEVDGFLAAGAPSVPLDGLVNKTQFQITPSSQNVVGMRQAALSSQSAPFVQWAQADGTVISSISVQGNAQFNQVRASTFNVTMNLLANGSAGTAGQVLQSNGTGSAPSWAAAGSGSPGGSSNQIQYNNGGSFGGIAGSTISTSGTIVAIQSQHAADIPISITGSPSQSGYLLKTADSSGNLLTVIDSVGDLTLSKYLNGSSDLYMSSTLVGGYGGFWVGHDNTTATGGNYAFLGNASTTLFNGAPDVEFRGNNLTGLILHNDGSVTRSVFGYAPTSASGDSTSDVSIIPFNSAYKGLVIRGASSQSANLQEWQDENGVAVSSITASGAFSIRPRTKAQLTILVPEAKNLIYTCSDCTTDGLVISTGTTAGAFGRISARTTVIN